MVPYGTNLRIIVVETLDLRTYAHAVAQEKDLGVVTVMSLRIALKSSQEKSKSYLRYVHTIVLCHLLATYVCTLPVIQYHTYTDYVDLAPKEKAKLCLVYFVRV